MKIKLLGFTPEQEEAFNEQLERETDALMAKREEEQYKKEGRQ
tara:strand:- start:8 stop:136 length:129 start_codon:yes stop_codon:yes gene_type:complete